MEAKDIKVVHLLQAQINWTSWQLQTLYFLIVAEYQDLIFATNPRTQGVDNLTIINFNKNNNLTINSKYK